MGGCGARGRGAATAWRRLASRGTRRAGCAGGGAAAEGSAPGGARPIPRRGLAMKAAAVAAGSGPLGFWRGGSGATAGGIPRVGGAAAGGGGFGEEGSRGGLGRIRAGEWGREESCGGRLFG